MSLHRTAQNWNGAKSDLLAAAKLAPKDKTIREHYERVKEQAKSEKPQNSYAAGFEKMLEEGGKEIEEDQLEAQGLGWKKLVQKEYTYPGKLPT